MNGYEQQKGGAACPIFPKRGPRAVVLCDGPPADTELLEYWLTGAEAFVCTDAAGYPYDELPAMPDVVIGDFDALAGRLLNGRGGPRFLQVDDQETTDSEKALNYLVEQGIEEAVLVAADGWRLDHTLFNCHLLERFADRLRICLASFDADVVRLGPNEPVSWKLPVGTQFSLLPLRGPARGVVLEGAEFPLLSGEVFVGGPATISNVVAQAPLLISLTEGSLLVSVNRTVDDDLAEFDPERLVVLEADDDLYDGLSDDPIDVPTDDPTDDQS